MSNFIKLTTKSGGVVFIRKDRIEEVSSYIDVPSGINGSRVWCMSGGDCQVVLESPDMVIALIEDGNE